MAPLSFSTEYVQARMKVAMLTIFHNCIRNVTPLIGDREFHIELDVSICQRREATCALAASLCIPKEKWRIAHSALGLAMEQTDTCFRYIMHEWIK